MPKKECPNGHWYDPSIYGNQCPLCPQPSAAPAAPAAAPIPAAPASMAGAPSTRIGGSAGPSTVIGGAVGSPQGGMRSEATRVAGGAAAPGPSGETLVRPKESEPKPDNPRTMIRRQGAAAQAPGRKLVGFLVTYSRNQMGRAFNLYEGRNFIGRDPSCDVAVTDDPQMSGRHFSILFRSVDSRFKFRDEQSSNGTFINKELLDDGNLENYDIIRAGGTIFIFMAIPHLG